MFRSRTAGSWGCAWTSFTDSARQFSQVYLSSLPLPWGAGSFMSLPTFLFQCLVVILSFPGGSDGKASAYNDEWFWANSPVFIGYSVVFSSPCDVSKSFSSFLCLLGHFSCV